MIAKKAGRNRISHRRRLQHSGLGLQALKFGVSKLQADELGIEG